VVWQGDGITRKLEESIKDIHYVCFPFLFRMFAVCFLSPFSLLATVVVLVGDGGWEKWGKTGTRGGPIEEVEFFVVVRTDHGWMDLCLDWGDRNSAKMRHAFSECCCSRLLPDSLRFFLGGSLLFVLDHLSTAAA